MSPELVGHLPGERMSIIQGIKDRFAARKFANSELGQALAQHCETFFGDGGLLGEWKQETKQRHVAELYYALDAAKADENPSSFIRETVSGFILHYAPLQALALMEAEKPHVGYGANPFISGALHHDIARLSEFVPSLKELSLDPNLPEAEWIGACNAMCLVDLFYINGMNYMRQEFGDVSNPDWLNPLVEALIVRAENEIREAAGMSLTLSDPLNIACYGNMMHFTMMRERNPFARWCRQYPDLYLAGQGNPTAQRPDEDFV
jgi:hypothetical protein